MIFKALFKLQHLRYNKFPYSKSFAMHNVYKTTCFLSSLIALLLFAPSLFAQIASEPYSLFGKVQDSATGHALPNATVQLAIDSLSTPKTIITTEDGSFYFSDIEKASCFIKITAVGYTNKKMQVIMDSSGTKNLGTILLSTNASGLKEVVVTASKPLIRQEIDKTVYDLEADPESKSSTVLDIMRKVPFLSQDADGNVLLKGSNDYKILINNKPSGMMDRNPTQVLRSIPASTIKSIEVITNPSSKYEAEGLAGIINIITNKKIDNGYSGTVSLNYKTPVGGVGTGNSFLFKKGKLGISLFSGIGSNVSPTTNSNYNRITKGSKETYLDQQIARSSGSRYAYLGSELSYELDSLSLISTQFNINGYRHHGLDNQASFLNGQGSVIKSYELANKENSKGYVADWGLNYQLGFRNSKERLLTFSYRYSDQSHQQGNDLRLDKKVQYTAPDYNQSNDGRLTEETLQVDYVHPAKKLTVEAGLKGIFRKNFSEFAVHVFNETDNLFQLDSSRTNNYNNVQKVAAAYNSYNLTIKNWGLKGGVRVEQTYVDADFISKGTKVDQRYTSLIPSLIISRKLKDKSMLNLSYTNRLRRPTIYQLNPFIDRSNPEVESAGNPKLKPATTDIVQLSYSKSKKGTVNIAIGGMFFNNLPTQVSGYDTAAKIIRTRFENLGTGRVLKTNIFMSYPITKQWTIGLNSDIRHIYFKGVVNNVFVHTDGFNANVNLTSGYRVTKSFRINVGGSFANAGLSGPQTKSNSYTTAYLTVSKDLLKDKLNFSCTLSNPWAKFVLRSEELSSIAFDQVSNNQTYFRAISLNATYRFGKLKEAVKKNKRGITNDDTN
jgi:hypothetical protein